MLDGYFCYEPESCSIHHLNQGLYLSMGPYQGDTFFFLLLLIRFSDASQYYHFISKVRLFFTWMITYSGSLDWHAPRQRACPLAAMSTGVRIGVAGADNALMVIYGQQRKSLSTFPLSFPSSRTVLHPQCWVHLPFFLSYALPSLLPAVT